MKIWLVVLSILVVGCHKEGSSSSSAPGAPPSTAAADALWALAPEGATVGVVASPRGLAMLDHAWADLAKLMKTAPELAAPNKQLEAALAAELGQSTVSLADLGLTSTKGGAFFLVPPDQGLVIVPLGDRDKFLKRVHGTKGKDVDEVNGSKCKAVHGVYACADSEQLFASMGKGKLRDQLGKLGQRGDLEAVVGGLPELGPLAIAGAMQLARGEVTAHGAVFGAPARITSRFGTPVKPRFEADHTTGFVAVAVSALAKQLPPAPIVPGVTLADLGGSIDGPLTVTLTAGQIGFDLRLPLSDDQPLRKLLDGCAQLPPLAKLGAKLENGTCVVALPPIGLEVDAWLDGKTLRIATKQKVSATAVAMTAAGKQLASQTWNVALWGRGTILGLPALPIPEPVDDDARLGMRVMEMVNELGFGARVDQDAVRVELTLRTAWANPDEVVAKLVAIPADDILHGRAGAAAKAIAEAAPSSPFAADDKAGIAGLAAPASVIGMLAAVAIPAFLDYQHHAKHTEAELQLMRIAAAAKVYYAEHDAFPTGDAPPPKTSCCVGPTGKCPADPVAWQAPVWKALDFELDEPHLFRYGYHSDGKTATAVAVADLDCDQNEITYRLDLSAPGGTPVSSITPPPPNSD